MDKKTKGCLLIGCGSLLFFVVVTGVILIVMGISTYNNLRSMTSETPVSMPVYTPSNQEKKSAHKKIETLLAGLKDNRTVSESLTATDINTLIAIDPRLKDFRGKIDVEIVNNKIKLKGSIPLKFIPGFRDRYLNGEVSLRLDSENQRVRMFIENIKFDKYTPSKAYLARLKEKNIMESFYNNPKYQKFLNRVKNLKIENNKLIIELTGRQNN